MASEVQPKAQSYVPPNTQSNALGDQPLSFEEAERLAAQIKPSWELDEGASDAAMLDGAHHAASATVPGGATAPKAEPLAQPVVGTVKEAETPPTAAIAGAPHEAAATAEAPASDGVIQGIPTISIAGDGGPSLPGEPLRPTEPAAPLEAAPAAVIAARPDPPPPSPPSPTRIGMGIGDAELVAASPSAGEAPAAAAAKPPPSGADPAAPAQVAEASPDPAAPLRVAEASPDPAAPSRVAEASAPPSRVSTSLAGDDSIDLPLGVPSRGRRLVIGGATAALIVGAVLAKVLTGSSAAPPAPKAEPAETQTAAPTATPPPPTPTNTAAPTPAAPPPAPPSATHASTTAAAPSPPPSHRPASKSTPKPANPSTSPPSGGKSGGIIRNAPF